jgi:alpha-galactosidase
MIAAGRPGFGFERGQAHAVHLAWSGNHRLTAERTTTGEAFLTAAEPLNPGEIRLAPGQRYSTPWALGSWGDGLTQLAGRFHAEPRHRHGPTPRPVTFNTWEAVYFDQSPGRLAHLAKAAAAVGAERFVLDDGWFRGRRDDTAGLGDWVADGAKWPLGLLPLAHQVRSLGMEFGLWVEPEMVNPDSDLARAHPDWILRGRSENPPSARHQQALDLANPRAYAHIAERLHALVGELGVAYLKWDHNRDLACAYAGGQARVHANVEALYRLMDGLRAAHPGLAIESCASGGARVDLGILGRANRIWPSDCIDPLERLAIQKYTGLLAPPEFMGAHLTASPVHSTGRAASLALSGGVALFGHFGIERDLTACGAEELAEITRWVALHKQWREQIAAGRMVHADLADPSLDVRGIVGPERRRALFAVTQMATGASYPAARFPLPGLDPAATYQVRAIFPPDAGGEPAQSRLAWIAEPVSLTGRQLGQVGLRAPVQFPGGLTLIEALALPGPTPTTPHNREGES